MAALRFAPLFALPILGGVLLAFVIATFEDDPEAASQASVVDDERESQPETIVEEPTAQATEPTPQESAMTDNSPADGLDPLAGIQLDRPFDVDDFSDYWRENLPPSLAEILENGFGGSGSRP
jgi:hypothetical protein